MADEWHAVGVGPESAPKPGLVSVRGGRHPALLVAALVAIGAGIADNADAGPSVWLAITLISLMAVLVMLRFRSYRILLIAAGVVLTVSLGAWRMAVDASGRPSASLTDLIDAGEPVELFGSLGGIPREKLRGWSAPIYVAAVRSEDRTVPLRVGALLSTKFPMSSLRHGDQVRLMARFDAPFVRRNPGGFDYANHLFRQGIDVVVRPVDSIAHCGSEVSPLSIVNLVEPVRVWFRSVFSVHLPKPARSLILGFLLGDTDQLTPGVMAAFRDSGTLHLLAVSGANVWLIVGLFIWPMRFLRIPRWPRAIILVAIVVAFSFLTRNEPSVVRASLMVAFILIGRLIYRPSSLLNAVGASALVILLASPSQLFRPGFQLSYAAVIGIAVVGQRTAQWSQVLRVRLLRGVTIAATASVAATVATAPIVAWHFGTVSLASLVANLAMIPLAAAGLYVCLALALLSVISVTAAGWMAYPANQILDLSSYMASAFAQMPGAHLSWPNPSPIWIAHLYAAGLLVVNWRHRYRWVRPAAWYTAGLVVVLITNGLMRPSAPTITLAYLDTGRTRVAGFSHPDGSLVWVADDPGIDDQLQQWVTGPFVRTQLGGVTAQRYQPWRRIDSSDAVIERQVAENWKYPAPVWRRYVSAIDSPSVALRVWADRFTWGADTVLCLRDYPTSPPGVSWLDSVIGSGHTLILPAATPDRLVRKLLDRLAPHSVVLFGVTGRWRDMDQVLERWRMRYPQTEFYSTVSNGCIQVRLSPDSPTIVPTIAESRWVGGSPGKA